MPNEDEEGLVRGARGGRDGAIHPYEIARATNRPEVPSVVDEARSEEDHRGPISKFAAQGCSTRLSWRVSMALSFR